MQFFKLLAPWLLITTVACGQAPTSKPPTKNKPLEEDVPFFKGKVPDVVEKPTHEGRGLLFYYNFPQKSDEVVKLIEPDMLKAGYRKRQSQSDTVGFLAPSRKGSMSVMIVLRDGKQMIAGKEEPTPGKGCCASVIIMKP